MNKNFESQVSRKPGEADAGLIRRLLRDSGNAWNFSDGKIILMWLIPVFIVAGAVVAALMGKPAYKWYTGEDQFAETVQVFLYAGAFVLNLIILQHLFKSGQKTVASLYLFVLLGLIFMIGEELSWGQRIFGWETAEEFVEINKQDETNLHNIYGVGSTFKWLQMVVGAYGTILPLLLLSVNFLKRNRSFFDFVIPHYSLIPFFFPMFVWRFYRNVFDAPKEFYFVVSEFNEVVEFILATGMFLFMLYQWRRIKAVKA